MATTGRARADRAILVVSGTHGMEGYAGSLCQSRWLKTHGHGAGADTTIVWLHAHNPYGFAWGRRVNEQNIDLNRNYHDGEPLPENPGYDELAHALDPLDLGEDTLVGADAALLEFAGRHGMDGIQAAVSAGQYRHPTGLSYGGTEPTHSQHVMREVLATHLAATERVVILDLHTGLGEYGALELITDEPPGGAGFDRARSWWGDHVVSMTSEDSVSADLAGTWLEPAERWLAPREVGR